MEKGGYMANAERPMEPGAGNLGLSRRSHNRLYYNASRPIRSVDYLINRQAPWASERVDLRDCERFVGRFLLTDNQLHEALSESEFLRDSIEAVVPIGVIDTNPYCMAMWGINSAERQTLVPLERMIEQTEGHIRPNSTPSERILSLNNEGFHFVQHIKDFFKPQIQELWGPIFGWSQSDVENLGERLNGQHNLAPHDRSIWFSALRRGPDIIAMATAERLNLPLGNNMSVPVIESTEWCTRPEWQQNGMMAGTVAHLHGQILEDLSSLYPRPIIVAETNFMTRADLVGNAVGMQVPPRNIGGFFVPQILRQNVAIGDGKTSDELRDFTMMYLPPESIESFYSSELRAAMLEGEDV